MARMKGIPSTRLQSVPSRFGPVPYQTEAARSKARREVNPWRNWYSTAEWIRLATECKVKANYTCQWPGCGRVCTGKGEAIADHVVPHRGDRALFLDPDNLQCLCKACHDSKKQREERASEW
ncbi:MAG: HNH endonuclease [Tabrizicola sp.]|nr:HNH endonuclease [Tabrizicola sp.]